MRYRVRALSIVLIASASIAVLAQAGKPPRVRQLRANGVDLAYVDEGQGTPVVFAHGAVSDLRFWEPQRAAFAKRHRFIAFSYRYHGESAWPDEGTQYSTEVHAADLAAFIAALNAGPVHLVGLSYGGLLGAMVAASHPQAIRTLTLAEPGVFSVLEETPEGKQVLGEWFAGAQPMIAAVKAGDTALATRQLSALVNGRPVEDFDKMPAGFREQLLDNARTLPLLLAAPPVTASCDTLRAIRTPTLVVRGERTPKVFTAIHEAVGRCIAGSTLAVVPDASHAMSYDNPAAFNRIVLDFIAKAPGAAASR